MTFKTADQINSHLIQLTKKERHITYEILLHIHLFQKISGYLKLGYPSMYAYMIGELKYSEDQAYRRLKAAKLLNIAPDVADKIKDGSISMTQAMLVQNVIKQSEKLKQENLSKKNSKNIDDTNNNPENVNSKHANIKSQILNSESELLKNKVTNIIQKIENKNSFETQKILAEDFNLPASVKDKVKPLSNKTVKLEIHFTTDQYDKLKKLNPNCHTNFQNKK